MKMEASRNNKGSLMLEICLSLAIFTIIISYTSLSISGITSYSYSIESSRSSLYKDKEFLEQAIVTEKIKLFDGVHENVDAKNITPCRKILSSDTLQALIVDSLYGTAIGQDCAGTEPSLSTSPTITTSLSFGSTTSMDVLNGNAFITRTHASSTESNFIVVDVNQQPTLLSQLATGSNLNTLDVTDEYAYIAARGTEHQFQIINITDPSHPSLVTKASLPGVGGSYPDAISIFYYDSKVYIGTHRTAGREFHVYDVSIPSQPQWLGSLELNHNINAIAIRGDYAYLATSGNTKDLIILDVSNPSKITIATSLSFLGNEDTLSLHLLGTILYAGRAKSTDTSHPEIVIVDIRNPLLLEVRGSIHVEAKIENIKVGGTTLYASLLGTGTKSGLSSLSIESMASTSLTMLSQSKIPLVDIDYENKKLYTLSSTGIISMYE